MYGRVGGMGMGGEYQFTTDRSPVRDRVRQGWEVDELKGRRDRFQDRLRRLRERPVASVLDPPMRFQTNMNVGQNPLHGMVSDIGRYQDYGGNAQGYPDWLQQQQPMYQWGGAGGMMGNQYQAQQQAQQQMMQQQMAQQQMAQQQQRMQFLQQQMRNHTSPPRNQQHGNLSPIGVRPGDYDRENVLNQQRQAQKLSYAQELQMQMAEKEQRKQFEKQREKQLELREEYEANNYNPWGRPGAGAPLRDRTGRVVADLRANEEINSLRLSNEAAFTNPSPPRARPQPQQPTGGIGSMDMYRTGRQYQPPQMPPQMYPQQMMGAAVGQGPINQGQMGAPMSAKEAARAQLVRDLDAQVQEKRLMKEIEKEKNRFLDAKEEQEAANYNPWGRPGAGAPLRGRDGRIMADLTNTNVARVSNMGVHLAGQY